MSATSFGTIAGFDNSHSSTNKKHTLNKIKSEAQFKDLHHGRDAMRLQQSNLSSSKHDTASDAAVDASMVAKQHNSTLLLQSSSQ